MTKRLLSAGLAVALSMLGSAIGSQAEARGSSASRSCLTPAARSLLGRIEAQFGQMQIVSTCRPGARIAGSGKVSRHASGNAIDFNAGSRKGAVVRWLVANHRSGGTMTYSHSSHIHVDIGQHFVSLSGSRTRVASARTQRTTRVAMETRVSRRVVAEQNKDSGWRPEMAIGSR
jgi:hypothetical protein